MRLITLGSLISFAVAGPALAQERWVPIGKGTTLTLAADLTSLRRIDSVLQVDVRSSPGQDVYDVVRYQVQCRTFALRTLSRSQYLKDLNRPLLNSSGKPQVIEYSESWFVFAPGSDGHMLAEAICRLEREQGLLG